MVWKMKVVGTIYGTHMLVKARRVFPRSVVKGMHVIIILRSIKKDIMTLTFYCPYVLRWFGQVIFLGDTYFSTKICWNNSHSPV